MPDFLTPQSLVQHLNSHVLSPSESYAWGLIWRGRFTCFSPDDAGDDECFRLRNLTEQMGSRADLGVLDTRPLMNQPGDQPGDSGLESLWLELLSAYRDEIKQAVSRSRRLRWWTSRDGSVIYIDPYGIVVICDGLLTKPFVLTAYVAGAASVDGVMRSRQSPSDTHARVSCGSRMRRNTEPDQDDLRERLRSRRSANWNEDQKIYYLIFRPAVQFIRGRQPVAPVLTTAYNPMFRGKVTNETTRDRRFDMAEVKAALPRMSQLDYDGWRNYLIEAEREPTMGSLSHVHDETR